MAETRAYLGQPVSEGIAVGVLQLGAAAQVGAVTPEQVAAAFAAVARERTELADSLRAAGRSGDAEIVGIGALIAADPALVDPAVAAVRDGADAATAITDAASAQAAIIAALELPELAERAADVRQVAAAVLEHLSAENGRPAPLAAPQPDASGELQATPVPGGAAAGGGAPGGGAPGGAAEPAGASIPGDGTEPDSSPASGGALILVRRELDPAELIRLADSGLAGAVSVTGGASSHAAIIARGLGIPMLTGADPQVLDLPDGLVAVLDAEAGQLLVGPPDLALAQALKQFAAQRIVGASGAGGALGAAGAPGVTGASSAAGTPGVTGAPRAAGAPGVTGLAGLLAGGAGPIGSPVPALAAGGIATTRDGQRVTVLCNVASAAETRLGLAAGAAGSGLVRTEVPFTGAGHWPSEQEHARWLAPVLELLDGRPAVVRLLDFSGDKVPPFLRGRSAGLAALLGDPRALDDQLRAILTTGRQANLAIMIPMVSELAQVEQVRTALAAAAAATGSAVPELGIMVEVASTARRASYFAARVGFFSIGTNDLAGEVLGLDRRDPRARPALAADPRVLELITTTVRAAAGAGIPVSVCGDSAADPEVLPLLIRLGVRRISIPAARVGQVAGWIAALDTSKDMR